MDQLLQNYLKVLKLHFGTKTTDLFLHQYLETVYTKFFEVLHTISEKRQDLSIDPSIDCDKASLSVCTLLESEMEILESMVNEKNTKGMDNLLRSLLDDLEFLYGNAQGFKKEEMEGDMWDSEKPKLWIKTGLIKK